MSENELSLLSQVGKSKYATKEAAQSVSKSADYLPYLGIFGGDSKPAKRGLIPVGHIGIAEGEKIVDLGKEAVVICFGWRPKAIDFGDMRTAYDPEHEFFKEVQANPKGCYGPELLLYHPETGKWCTFHLMNKTGRRESPNFLGPLEESPSGVVTFKIESKEIEGKNKKTGEEYLWHGPKASVYEQTVDMPADTSENLLILQKFQDPPALIGAESAEESDRE